MVEAEQVFVKERYFRSGREESVVYVHVRRRPIYAFQFLHVLALRHNRKRTLAFTSACTYARTYVRTRLVRIFV